MNKISYRDYRDLIEDPQTEDDEIIKYSIVQKGEGGFDFQLRPNPDKVELTADQMELENAMGIANDIARWRRKNKFKIRLKNGSQLPIIVSEGDSWFQFPLIIKDVVDQLKSDYLIYSVGAAGDTADNMVFKAKEKKKTEYMIALRKLRDQGHTVSGFMFSAAGNDIIGEDPETKISALEGIIKDFNGDPSDVVGHINFIELSRRLGELNSAYKTVIKTIREEEGFSDLPIFIHGYDYVFPYKWTNDNRDPFYADQKEWLGEPLDNHNIEDLDLRRNIIKFLLDMLYDMMNELAGLSTESNVWVVDCRGSMPDVSDWNDEIHGTNKGFKKVAQRFRTVMSKVIKS